MQPAEIQVNEITKLTPTKTNVLVVANEMTEAVLNGDVDPIEFAIRCEFGIKVLTESKEIAKKEALKNFSGKRTLFGATVESVETGTNYDYSSNDEWVKLNNEIISLTEKRKAVEEKLKLATKTNTTLVDGDEIIATPVQKISTTSLKITLGK